MRFTQSSALLCKSVANGVRKVRPRADLGSRTKFVVGGDLFVARDIMLRIAKKAARVQHVSDGT